MVDSMIQVEVRQMIIADIKSVCELMARDPELAFCPWENSELFEKELSDPNSVILVAEHDGEIVGGLIGGGFADLGMICHVVVDAEHRSRKIGSLLVEQAIGMFENMKVKKIHLFLTAGNTRAERFWQKLQFNQDRNYGFLEYDIPDSMTIVAKISAAQRLESEQQILENCSLFPETLLGNPDIIEPIYRQKHGVILRVDAEGKPSIGFGGNYGFRAEIRDVSGEAEAACCAVSELCQHFASQGVRRIHVRVAYGESSTKDVFKSFGFQPVVGEKLYCRDIY